MAGHYRAFGSWDTWGVSPMTEAVRIGVVAEGPTDIIALQAVIKAILKDQPFIITPLRPQKVETVLGGTNDASQPIYAQKGWSGVHNWCQEVSTAPQGENLIMHQIVVIHLDVDVAGFTYASANITQLPTYSNLPCEKPCPPASDSADALIDVAKSWLLPVVPPSNWLWCCPGYNMETWAYTAYKPQKACIKSKLECSQDISGRVTKTEKAYKEKYAKVLESRWTEVQRLCSLAQQFTDDLCTCIATI